MVISSNSTKRHHTPDFHREMPSAASVIDRVCQKWPHHLSLSLSQTTAGFRRNQRVFFCCCCFFLAIVAAVLRRWSEVLFFFGAVVVNDRKNVIFFLPTGVIYPTALSVYLFIFSLKRVA